MSAQKKLEAQVIALSALLLAVDGVELLATKGTYAQENYEALFASLLRFNQDNLLDYYDNLYCLERGRQLLLRLLQKKLSPQKMRYALQLIYIERKLSKNSVLMQTLRNKLLHAQQQAKYFEGYHENVVANFADIYSMSASEAARKMKIYGNASYLEQKSIANHVRALLLCGIRACALWCANGGSRWQLIFNRENLETCARSLDFNVLVSAPKLD